MKKLKTTAEAQERLTSIEAMQLGNIYLALLGDTDICERPVVIQRGSHELISESVTPEYPKHRKKRAI